MIAASPALRRIRDLVDYRRSSPLLWIIGGFFALYTVVALLRPEQLIIVIAAGMLACAGILCFRMPVLSCTLWLLVVGSTPEMWLPDIIPGTSNLATALVKASGYGLVALCIVRYGLVLDGFNPGFAYVAMFFIGIGHGLHPNLTVSDSLRTVMGAAAPYAFSFSRLSRRWSASMIEATMWIPTLVLVFGALLDGAGLRPLFSPDEAGSVRLGGSTHPAFLAVLSMTALYAALIEIYRGGRTRHMLMFGLNLVVLVATGSRSPLVCGVVVSLIAFFGIRSETFTLRRRATPLIVGLMSLPVLVVIAVTTSSLRLFTVVTQNAGSLSGRDVIWPIFQRAWDQSPLFGWGVGTGKVLIDPDSLVAKLLGTTAAHNEYLRIGVDGGYVGIALVAGTLALWAWRWTSVLPRPEKIIIRLIMVGVGVECITDNMLIASPTSVLFTWMSAVFARGALHAARNEER